MIRNISMLIFNSNKSSNTWLKWSLVTGMIAVSWQIVFVTSYFSIIKWFLRIGLPILVIYYILKLGETNKIPSFKWTFFPVTLPQPDPITYCEHYDINEIKRSALWVPVAFNYLLIFLWVSFFSILFYNPEKDSYIFYIIVLSTFTTCFILFLWLTNLFKRKLEPSLYCMSCNLIILFTCGIATSSLNNLTHYLHHKDTALYDIGFQVIPEIPLQYAETSDIILVSYIILCVLLSLFLHPSIRNKMWSDFGRISSIMILSKGIMGWWTLLPGPAPHCRPGSPNYAPKTIKQIFTSQGTMFGHALNCGDLIFSGHTGFLVTVMLLSEELWKTSHIGIRWLWRLFTLVILILFSVFCIAARKHYSVDIICAIWIAFLNFCTFRYSWIPVYFTYPITRTVIVRTAVSGSDSTKADTILVSEEKFIPHIHQFSVESESG